MEPTDTQLFDHTGFLPGSTPEYISKIISSNLCNINIDKKSPEVIQNEAKLKFFYNNLPQGIYNGLISEIQTGWDHQNQEWLPGMSNKYNRKTVHTIVNVPVAAVDIMLKETGEKSLELAKNDPLFSKKLIGVAVHDLARFEQALTTGGTFDDNRYEHGYYSALKTRELLSNMVYQGEISLDEEEITALCESAFYHNKREVHGNVESIDLCNFVRDADKLAILREESYFGKGNGSFPGTGISENAFKIFMSKNLLRNADINSSQDQCLHRLAWIYDMGDAALQIMHLDGIVERTLIELFTNYDAPEFITSEQVNRYREIVNKVDQKLSLNGTLIDTIAAKVLDIVDSQ